MSLLLLLLSVIMLVETVSAFKGSLERKFYPILSRKEKCYPITFSSSLFRQPHFATLSGIEISYLNKHVDDGNYLKTSVQYWLDTEYYRQEINAKLGREVERIYIQRRMDGIIDLGEMLMDIGTSLETFDMEDAFVNGWDVANKVSDLLILRMGKETASCAGDMAPFKQISDKIDFDSRLLLSIRSNKALMSKISLNFSSTFKRFGFLRDILEGEALWSEVEVVLFIMLGYRVVNKLESELLLRNIALCAYGWESVYLFPDADFLKEDIKNSSSEMNKRLERRMTADIPEDEGSTDVLCESLVGLETYALMKAVSSSSNSSESDGCEVEASEDLVQASRRRILLVKWLYVHGFVDTNFPATSKFIPADIARNL